MRKALEIGGLITALVLVAFGVAAIAMGFDGRSTVSSSLEQEQIVGTPDMTPTAIEAAGKRAGLPETTTYPSCSVADTAITTGTRARCFASYMRIHALEAAGGKPYATLPRYATADGKGTNDPTVASTGADGQPVANPARETWVTETALATALNTSYMAEQLSLFAIVIGIALVLTGLGFGILAVGGALQSSDSAIRQLFRRRGSPPDVETT